MALRTLYLRRFPSAAGRGSLAGRKLYDRLRDESEDALLGHVALAEAGGVDPRLASDVVTPDVLRKLAPNLIYLEGGLFANRHGLWRVPRDVLEPWVAQGGVAIVADVDHTEAEGNLDAYRAAAGFLAASIDTRGDGTPVYGYDEASCDGGPRQILCQPDQMTVSDWLRPALAGVSHLLVNHPVRLTGREALAASCNRDTTATLQSDLWVDRPEACPFAHVAQVGHGFVVLVTAGVSSDWIAERSPGNLDWIVGLAKLLVQEARRDSARSASHLRSPHRLFVSHRSVDKTRVEPIVRALERRGVATWYDRDRLAPSDSLPMRISSGLGDMTHFALLWSASCVGAPWVERELSAAVARLVEKGIPILPVRLDATPLPPILADLVRIEAQAMSPAEVAEALHVAIGRLDARGAGRGPGLP